MHSSRDKTYLAKLNEHKVMIFALSSFLVGFVLLLVASKDYGQQTSFEYYRPVVRDLGSLIMTTGMISGVYELLMKRSFSEEILGKVNLSKDVSNSGLIQLTFNPKEMAGGILWSDLILNSKRIDVFFVHGIGWRLNNEQFLIDAGKKKGVLMRFFLPNFNNDENLNQISLRYNKSKGTLKKDIITSAKQFSELKKGTKANIEVRLTDFAPPHSMYCFDDIAIIAFSSSGNRKTFVPHFIGTSKTAGPSIFSFVDHEFEELINKSVLVTDDYFENLDF